MREAGIVGRRIERGEIYVIADAIIRFPQDRLPNSNRTTHQTRMVLVLQCNQDNQNPSYRQLLVAPLSHKTEYQDATHYLLHKGQGGLNQDSLVMLDLVQSLLKIELSDRMGKVDTLTMTEIDAVLAANLGLIDRPQIDS